MNTKRSLYFVAALAALFLTACGNHDDHDHDGHDHASHESHDHDDHGHDHDHGDTDHDTEFAKQPGPNGGRLITTLTPSVEFLLRDDLFAQLTFVGPDGTIVPASSETASLVTGDRMNPVTIVFEKQGNFLVSTQPLPADQEPPVILTITPANGSSPIKERFTLQTHTCSGCGLQEYACICGH